MTTTPTITMSMPIMAVGDRGRMPFEFNDVDRQPVLCLQRDGRATYSSMAAHVGMSHAAVRARVQRLSGLILRSRPA